MPYEASAESRQTSFTSDTRREYEWMTHLCNDTS